MENRNYKITAIITITALIAGAVMVIMPNKFWSKERAGSVEFVIENGQSLSATARLLAKHDLALNFYIFVAYAIISGQEKELKAGRYLISSSASIKELVKIFAEGRSEPEDTIVTIPEGTNIADIDKILAKVGVIKAGEFLKVTLPDEGYLFPDTYRLRNHQQPITNHQIPITNNQPSTTNSRAEEIIQKMEDNFKTKTAELFKSLTVQEIKGIIVIASILEKEVKTEQDMRLVAGIIEKRLELGMPLEIDATVIYGVCYSEFLSGKYCDVSLANIVDNIPKDSVYNTYKRRGLPKGPISNPGLRAISAVLNPQSSNYLFYLSAKDGTTVFSKTAAEHLRARQKYLK